jgi:hypothetical protein
MQEPFHHIPLELQKIILCIMKSYIYRHGKRRVDSACSILYEASFPYPSRIAYFMEAHNNIDTGSQ